MLMFVFYRKILLADTEAANSDSMKEDMTKEKEKSEDSALGSSLNSSSHKPGNCDTLLHTAADSHAPDVETNMSDTKDSVPAESSDASAAVSKVDVDNDRGDILTSDAAANAAGGGQCSEVSAVASAVEETLAYIVQAVEEAVGETVPASAEKQSTETDADNHEILPAAVADCNERQTESGGEAKSEQTVTLDDTSCTDENKSDLLRGKAPDLSPYHELNVKSSTESTTDLQTDLSRALMNEVNCKQTFYYNFPSLYFFCY